MNDVVIKIENVSKQYRLGNVGTGSFAHDLNRVWYKLRGKEDPYLKIGEENERTVTGASDYVWALRDVNFEVRQGEVLGIIGRNGAGKSTLLKILSRTTSPTTGEIKIKGRAASLLEIGTGFHPELTGRENIFLNGAILGMNKQSIRAKLDEIIDFSGVERYIDTPVKRYSSGMYVRLAFAVAAHLEPEILIVDEVLAVGDADFQKKCLGKMDMEATKGRTIIFVSHNLIALKALCPNSILLNNGKIRNIGSTSNLIKTYLNSDKEATVSQWRLEFETKPEILFNEYFFLKSFYITYDDGKIVDCDLDPKVKYIYLVFEGDIQVLHEKLSVGFALRDNNDNFLIINRHTDLLEEDQLKLNVGRNLFRVKIDISFLNEGEYFIDYSCGLWGIYMINSGEENKISVKFKISGLRGNQAYLKKRRDCILSPYLFWEKGF